MAVKSDFIRVKIASGSKEKRLIVIITLRVDDGFAVQIYNCYKKRIHIVGKSYGYILAVGVQQPIPIGGITY
jgi:hypothetical protein